MNTRAFFLWVFLPYAAFGAAQLDQEFVSNEDGGFIVSGSQWIGQTFRASVSGFLTSVDLDLARNPARTGSLQFLLCRINDPVPAYGDLPLGTQLFSTRIPFESIQGAFNWVNVSLGDSATALAAGKSYAIILKTDVPAIKGGVDPVAWRYSENGTYTGGTTIHWVPNLGVGIVPQVDSGFRTYMTAVPEPSIPAVFTFTATFAVVAIFVRQKRSPI
jgi:hypothetical protein